MTPPIRRLGEDDAHRLLARAVELDASQERPITLDELRAIALEAGIAPEAFDRATAEHFAADGPASAQRRPFWSALTSSVKAVAVSWITLGILAWVCRLAGVDWQIRHLADVLALLAGAVTAHRLGARVARIGFIGMGAALLVQWLIQIAYGIGTVQGSANHLAVIGAGVLGAAGTALAARIGIGGTPQGTGYASASAEVPEATDDRSQGIGTDTRALRLRAI